MVSVLDLDSYMPCGRTADPAALGRISMKLMCISLYDVNSGEFVEFTLVRLDGQTAEGCLAIQSTGGQSTGGAYRDRTDDPLLAKQVLSQLS